MSMQNGKFTVASKFAHLNPLQDTLGDGISSGFTRIGFKGKVWALIHDNTTYRFVRTDDGTPLPYLDVVFVGQNKNDSRVYYSGGYNEDNSGNPPVCASMHGVVPDPGVSIPQSKTCAMCKNAEWGSGQGRGKACQEHRRTAVLLLPYMKTRPAMETAFIEPVFFKVPPASLRSFHAYGSNLARKGIHWATCITRVGFKPDRQFEMQFEFVQMLTDNEADDVLRLMDSSQTRIYTVGSSAGVAQITQQAPQQAPQQAHIETGLGQAFAKAGNVTSISDQAAPKKQGRPKKVVADAPPTQAAAPAPAPAPAPKPAPVETVQDWGDDDAELDADVAASIGQHVTDMMK